VGGELDFDAGLAQGFPAGAAGRNHTAAAHAFVQSVLPTGVGLAGGVGTGVLRGVGSPRFRVFAAFTYTPVDRDPDRDRILGRADACPDVAEDVDSFEDQDGCPEEDNDADGVVDLSDLCPDQAEDPDGWDDPDGCPDPDNDFDKVLDGDDACPTERGTVEARGCPDRDGDTVVDSADTCPDLPGLPELAGCPDRDGDKVPEPRDLCPDAPILPGVDPATSDGCPPKVAVAPVPAPTAAVYRKGNEIVITERVEFDLGKATLRPSSHRILDQVAKLLVETPAVKKLEVQGHTDNVGSDTGNLKLSQERADSVAAYLAAHGVARDRLTAKGYGEAVPMFSNRTTSGRDGNRRVQFLILDAAAGEERVTPPPAPLPVPLPVVAPLPPAPLPAVAPAVTSGPPGSLAVVLPSGVWGTVILDGTTLSKAAPFEGHELSPGTHTIVVQNSRLKLDWTNTFVVEPGKPVRLAPMGGAAPAPAPTPLLPAPAPEDDNPWKVDDVENPWDTAAPDGAPEVAPAPAPAPAPPAPDKKPPRKSKKR
jgi:outer membrane protein OmpA-like peptidoglycan-associated protein